MKDKIIKSTIWLDFYSYIFIPFYIFVLSKETLKIDNKLSFNCIFLIIIIIFSTFTLINLVKKNKLSYYLLYIFHILCIISIGIYAINKFNIVYILYKVELLLTSLIVWIIPNYIYLYKRRTIFYKHSVAHIKKCPGCNRIIPIHMTSCGRCEYKEEKND